jgi:hypothetical protein
LKEYIASTSGMKSNQSRKPARSRQLDFASLTLLSLMMETVWFSETSVDFYWTAQHYIPGDSIFFWK